MSKREDTQGSCGDEFPPDYLTTPPSDDAAALGRRGFMGFVTAAMALVGAEGCRRPVEKVVPYQKLPEQVIPGVASHYATVYARRGDAVGLLVETHEGRPTKIEGNPQHPSSLGATDLLTQASILDLYDMDRSRTPKSGKKAASWADFEAALKAGKFEADQGAKLHVLLTPTNSPSVVRLRGLIKARLPKATFRAYSPIHEGNIRQGAKLAYGAVIQPVFAYDKAGVVLSLDCDFLQTEAGSVRANKGFATGRRPVVGAPMNRLYVVEPTLTTTGAAADHRVRVAATDVERVALALAAHIAALRVPLGPLGTAADKLAKLGVGDAAISEKWLKAVAKDLVNNRGRALIVAGSRQPARVHALVHALNEALGNAGQTVTFASVLDPEEADPIADIAALAKDMADGKVGTLLILGGNPVYDAPADLKFAEALAKVQVSVHLAMSEDETGERCTWQLPRAHEYEAWGDQRALDGTVSVQQPLITPLFDGRSEIEVLSLLTAGQESTGYDIVRATVRADLLAAHGLSACGAAGVDGKVDCRDVQDNKVPFRVADLDRDWKRALAEGVVRRGVPSGPRGSVRMADVAAAFEKSSTSAPVSKDSLEVVFVPCSKLFDGRHANNVWLQELPDPITKLVWDNAALVSPKTAKELGLKNGDVVKLTRGERSISVGVWLNPGQANNSVAIALGWGRKKAGRIGNGKGFDAYPLRTTDAAHVATGVKLSKEGSYDFAVTQEHASMEHRPLARETTWADFQQHSNFAELQEPTPRLLPLWTPQDYSKGNQWGLIIDLNACTGCSACTVACQAENNVAVVGKVEVARGREMTWLRIDRYYVTEEHGSLQQRTGATEEDPLVVHQPIGCVHCENAPCENVCPVNATTHSPEGLNEMAYNRCIGTRYCANNCPYKVRRFNYLNWHNDGVWAKDGNVPDVHQMQHNPNVTVRFRGVMEKCTYCVQRIQKAKIVAKRENRVIRDGEVVVACQQACPADAIVFGDLNDPQSRVARAMKDPRRYALLGEIGTKPRTTYLGKVRNPNPEIV